MLAAATVHFPDMAAWPERASPEHQSANPELLLNSSLLSERMKGTVRKHDIAALWSAGAHPMALLYFARACGWTNDHYYNCISAVELRQAAPSVPAPPSGPELPQTHQ